MYVFKVNKNNSFDLVPSEGLNHVWRSCFISSDMISTGFVSSTISQGLWFFSTLQLSPWPLNKVALGKCYQLNISSQNKSNKACNSTMSSDFEKYECYSTKVGHSFITMPIEKASVKYSGGLCSKSLADSPQREPLYGQQLAFWSFQDQKDDFPQILVFLGVANRLWKHPNKSKGFLLGSGLLPTDPVNGGTVIHQSPWGDMGEHTNPYLFRGKTDSSQKCNCELKQGTVLFFW